MGSVEGAATTSRPPRVSQASYGTRWRIVHAHTSTTARKPTGITSVIQPPAVESFARAIRCMDAPLSREVEEDGEDREHHGQEPPVEQAGRHGRAEPLALPLHRLRLEPVEAAEQVHRVDGDE